MTTPADLWRSTCCLPVEDAVAVHQHRADGRTEVVAVGCPELNVVCPAAFNQVS